MPCPYPESTYFLEKEFPPIRCQWQPLSCNRFIHFVEPHLSHMNVTDDREKPVTSLQLVKAQRLEGGGQQEFWREAEVRGQGQRDEVVTKEDYTHYPTEIVTSTMTLPLTSAGGDSINPGRNELLVQRAVSFKPLPGRAVSTNSWRPGWLLRGRKDSPLHPLSPHYSRHLAGWVYVVDSVSSLHNCLATEEVTGLCELDFSSSE